MKTKEFLQFKAAEVFIFFDYRNKYQQRSNIGYLHVVNSNPTQLRDVNAVFLKSLAIANELETEFILQTFYVCKRTDKQPKILDDTIFHKNMQQ